MQAMTGAGASAGLAISDWLRALATGPHHAVVLGALWYGAIGAVAAGPIAVGIVWRLWRER